MMKGVQERSSSDRAYSDIRDKIITTVLKPGERIHEKALSEEFGISRTPIREALMRLRYDGFVDIFAQRGTFVTPIRLEVVKAAHYTRSVLECALIRDAATQCSDRDARDLYDNLEHQRLVYRQGQYYKIEILDEELHQKIADIAGRPSVWQIIYHVQLHINRVRMLFLNEERVPAIVQEHSSIIDAIAKRDSDAAENAMKIHLQYMDQNIQKLAESYSEYLS
ncbi:GntR family transcriptional regulator [Salinicola sp. V024]|uniref:GntR family transcriptional regulator n=1 Tax=Salinicola sp. V024 TaxID=3459609 RepID=UPI00404467FF